MPNLPPPSSADASQQSTRSVPSVHWTSDEGAHSRTEDIAVEAALCIEISYTRNSSEIIKALGITMRSPGQDRELVLGFLLAEGVIVAASDVREILERAENHAGECIETVRVVLLSTPKSDLRRVTRSVTTTSACGLCGRATLEGLPLGSRGLASLDSTASTGEEKISARIIGSLPEKLKSFQSAFARTGGTHGAALADRYGEIISSREDVGRHNAVDKLFGAALLEAYPLSGCVLVLSGRASFELVQKASAAGVPVIVAVGAPSSAAVDLAHRADITLIGFNRGNRFNIYTRADRVALE